MTDPVQRMAELNNHRMEAHRADVAYVQEHHSGLAEWLTEMVREFGRDVEYRVVLK